MIKISAQLVHHELKTPVSVFGHRWDDVTCILATAEMDGVKGQGEGMPIFYRKDEKVDAFLPQVEAVDGILEKPQDRRLLAGMMPSNGARNAVDAALWDLEAKLTGKRVWELAGREVSKSVVSVQTVYLAEAEEMAKQADGMSNLPILKVKLGGEDDGPRILAVREAAPNSRLVVDANVGWSVAQLVQMFEPLKQAEVEMVEQPLHPNFDHSLRGIDAPIPLCADESLQTTDDLLRCAEVYDVVNIKLDKCGGLTSALVIQGLAHKLGLKTMVGNMIGTSLGMAPAHVIAQQCAWSDIDGPISLAEDVPYGLSYDGGEVAPPTKELWG